MALQDTVVVVEGEAAAADPISRSRRLRDDLSDQPVVGRDADGGSASNADSDGIGDRKDAATVGAVMTV